MTVDMEAPSTASMASTAWEGMDADVAFRQAGRKTTRGTIRSKKRKKRKEKGGREEERRQQMEDKGGEEEEEGEGRTTHKGHGTR